MSRFEFVADHRDAFGVKRLCTVLNLSRSGFYRWLKTAPARAAKKAADAALTRQIRTVPFFPVRWTREPNGGACSATDVFRTARIRAGPSNGAGSASVGPSAAAAHGHADQAGDEGEEQAGGHDGVADDSAEIV